MSPEIFKCAQLSQAVYELAVPEGMTPLATQALWHRHTQTKGMCYVMGGKLYLAFAGSEIPAHWLSNVKIKKKNAFGWLPAHRGFAECAEAVLSDCLQLVDAWPDRDVVLTGHSRGAAIATLLAAALSSHLRQSGRDHRITLITFAQPRVARGTLLRSVIHGQYVRVVNGSDAVPRVPRIGYSHAGTCLYLRNRGGYEVDPSPLAMFLDRVRTVSQRATDHLMADYIRQLQMATI